MSFRETLSTLDARIPRGSIPEGLAVLGQVLLAFGVWAICFSFATHWYGPSADQFEYGGVAVGVLLLAAGALLYRGLSTAAAAPGATSAYRSRPAEREKPR